MESLKKSLEELTEHFNTRMADFQKDLKCSIPAANPTSNINSQFLTFRSFVLNALESLQLQLQLLTRQQDEMEMRSRRKILLVHGVSEFRNKADLANNTAKFLSDRLQFSIPVDSITQCHYLGPIRSDKQRALIVKFKDVDIKNKVWFAKTNLKGSGVTLSEFLTRSRHEAFIAARKRFGISKCWTRDGCVMVLGPDGKRHRIVSLSELKAIVDPDVISPVTAASAVSSAEKDTTRQMVTMRSKKPIRK